MIARMHTHTHTYKVKKRDNMIAVFRVMKGVDREGSGWVCLHGMGS